MVRLQPDDFRAVPIADYIVPAIACFFLFGMFSLFRKLWILTSLTFLMFCFGQVAAALGSENGWSVVLWGAAGLAFLFAAGLGSYWLIVSGRTARQENSQ